MTTAQDEGALSLYFDLKAGEKADLEVVALAALNWVSALRAAAREIDPNAVIKVELLDAAEGSLRLNTVLDWLESQFAKMDDGAIRHWRLKKIAIALAVFIPVSGIPTYDYYFGADQTIELSEEDRRRIDELIELTRGNPEVEEKSQEFFRALEKDPSIKGVGLTEKKDVRPDRLIPSSEFPEKGGLWSIAVAPEIADDKRTIYPVLDVTLISPALVKKQRTWRFQPNDGLPEFSAKMADDRFLAALEEDHVRENLRIGIQMKIRLKVDEEKIGGVWTVKRRSVIEVLSPATDQ